MMLKRLLKDEAGVALGLAIIMIVLIGVMGAGLLTFVMADLNAVVEVNQGQKALETADAGVQAARRQLLSDATATATTNVYDNDTGNGNSPWSAVSGGKNLTFDTNTVNVKIQYLLPSDTSGELQDSDHAPKLVTAPATDYPEPVDYFKITAEATAGDARRKVEAIYLTKDMGVPKGYYTPGNIEVKGTACIDSVSLFTLSNITLPNNNGGNCKDDVTGNSIGPIKGKDNAYRFWINPPFNTVARSTDNAGFGAVGSVRTVNGNPTPMAGTRDFDTSTCPKFVQDLNASSSCAVPEKMTFPFDYALPDIDFLRDEAIKQEAESMAAGQNQNHYEEVNASTKDVTTWPTPPAGSDPARTVVFYKFMSPNGSNNLSWKVGNSCSNPPEEGTLVIEGGNFKTTQNTTPLKGAVIVRGGLSTEEGASTDTGGNTCLQGFINASGGVTIAGSVKPTTPADLADKRPGFYGVELWSWRELYQ